MSQGFLIRLLLPLLLCWACVAHAAPPDSVEIPVQPRLGLVLSGGGGRGFAHVGVLRALEQAGLPLYCLVGSSTGAVVGGLYACGYTPDEIDSLLGDWSWGDLFQDRADRRLMYTGRREHSDRHLLEVRFEGWKLQWVRSLSSGQRVSQALAEMVWRAPIQGFGDFDRLRMRFRAVATDLRSGLRVELGGGDLAEAMRASMSVPFLFQPVTLDGRLLIDGGIADNIPVETARKLGADVVLAVDVTSPLRGEENLREAWELADQIVGIMQAAPNRRSLAAADLVVRPLLPETPMDHFDRRSFVLAGEMALEAQLDHLRRKLSMHAMRMGEAVEEGLDSLTVDYWDGEDWRPLEDVRPGLPDCQGLDSARGVGRLSPSGIAQLRHQLAGCGCFARVEVEADSAAGVRRMRLVPFPVVECVELRGLEDVQRMMTPAQWGSLGLDSLEVRLGMGRPLRRDRLEAEVDALLIRLRRLGYSLCALDSLSLEAGTLFVDLQPGRVDEVLVDGLVRLRPSVVLREFRPRAGELFTVDRADQGIRALYASGLYEQVYLRMSREDDRNVAVIHARERAFPALRLGWRYSSAREGEGFAQLIWENLLRRSLRGEFTWLEGAWRSERRASIESDRIWRTWLTTRFSVWHDWEELHGFHSGPAWPSRETWVAQVRLGQQIQRLGSVFLSGAVEWREDGGTGTELGSRLVRLGAMSQVDSRDRVVLTRRGELHEVVFEQLVPWGTGDDPAFRASVRLDSWRSAGRHTGHLSLLAGTTDSPARRDHFEFGGEDWVRSLGRADLSARRALGVMGVWRVALGRGERRVWSAAARWAALGLTQDLDSWPRRRDLLQEAGLSLHLDSRVGELVAGLALLTDRGRVENPGARLWVELGHPF
jgi:predicted acylesterase/phospholipase RssA